MAAWITNDPEVAAKLQRADRAYEDARSKARNLKLSDKISALREAAEARAKAYAAAASPADPQEH